MGFSDLEIITFCFINISCCTTLPFHLELYEVSFFKQLPGGYKGEKNHIFFNSGGDFLFSIHFLNLLSHLGSQLILGKTKGSHWTDC